MIDICLMCGKNGELCPDFVCRACHVSVSWDDCVSKTFNARILINNGRSREDVLEIYPEAKV